MRKPYKFHLHTHSSHENESSMRGIAYHCKRLGLDGAFVTDHDTRMGVMSKNAYQYDISAEKRINTHSNPPVSGEFWAGWTPVENVSAIVGDVDGKTSMVIESIPGGDCAVGYFSHGKKHQVSFLAQLVMCIELCGIGFDPAVHGVMLDITLSQRPPDLKTQHLCYCAGRCPELPDNYWTLPLGLSDSWQEFTLPLTKDALSFDSFGGEDNCFSEMALRLYCPAGSDGFKLAHSRFGITRELASEELRRYQQTLADKIAAHYGVTLHVATEVSSLGQHKISFSESVPVFNYEAAGYPTDVNIAIEFFKKYNGVYAYNHMFDSFKRVPMNDEQREVVVLGMIEKLYRIRCDYAYLLEVGFTSGRSGFTMEQHTRVWDALALRGLFLTGYGDNDSHSCLVRWDSDSNFCAFIFADSTDRAMLVDKLKRGDTYSADPAKWKGSFDLCCGDTPMGGVIRSQYGQDYTVTASVAFDAPYRIVVRSHERILTERILVAGEHALQIPITTQKAVEAVRAEIYEDSGRCILMSNPVYLVSDPSIEIPEYRIY